ncbi:hypothetical protein GCM10010324_10920 [Streptomyces hiroshimensis]|uniref:Uncharacterized protein n=1 Tax=Streptomyces hiroshimensis TaxID=66424 RepID=A0ABQ2Y5Q7_9ACTN|nr:hypothetical protein GCM10010324_10920 [Streptomyces hiroshimensis]
MHALPAAALDARGEVGVDGVAAAVDHETEPGRHLVAVAVVRGLRARKDQLAHGGVVEAGGDPVADVEHAHRRIRRVPQDAGVTPADHDVCRIRSADVLPGAEGTVPAARDALVGDAGEARDVGGRDTGLVPSSPCSWTRLSAIRAFTTSPRSTVAQNGWVPTASESCTTRERRAATDSCCPGVQPGLSGRSLR